MPRNDQLIRQWTLLQLLESSRGFTLDEIVERLPSDYPKHGRTVRRDLEALEAAGFPLINERIEGRVRWRLMDGFRQKKCRAWSRLWLPTYCPTQTRTYVYTKLASSARLGGMVLYLLPTSSLDQSKRARVLFLFPIGWTMEPPAPCEGCPAPRLRSMFSDGETHCSQVRPDEVLDGPSLRSQAAAGPCGFTTRRSSGCTSSRFSFREHKD